MCKETKIFFLVFWVRQGLIITPTYIFIHNKESRLHDYIVFYDKLILEKN